jgi:hypothetical protein
MHQRRFEIDDWEPIYQSTKEPEADDQTLEEPVAGTQRVSVFVDLKLRHYLVLFSAALLVLGAPLAWFLSKDWPAPILIAGFALLLMSVASMLAPDAPEYRLE